MTDQPRGRKNPSGVKYVANASAKRYCSSKRFLLRVPVDQELLQLIKKGIEALNEGGLLEVKPATFARQAINYYAQMCITKNVSFIYSQQPEKNMHKVKIKGDRDA